MAKFTFELEALLEQRRREERDRMRALGVLEQERLAIERAAASLGAALRDEREALRAELAGGRSVDLGRVRLQSGASLHGVRRTHELALSAAAVLKRLDAARVELLHATTRRRAVEKLRERRLEAWIAGQRRLEAMALDELITSRFGGGEQGAAA
ncbi:MAG: flagellar FliJ family protein [Phycisphaerales bacterium]|nr:flagellar FliJ family protein [Phycisphaerales bacterium]